MRRANTSSAPVVAVRRKHRTMRQRRETVETYERSGLSQVEFCEREGVSTASLANWRGHLCEEAAKPAPPVGVPPTAAFIELGSTRPLEFGLRVRIELGAGVVLVAITASSRAGAVQARSRAGLDNAAAGLEHSQAAAGPTPVVVLGCARRRTTPKQRGKVGPLARESNVVPVGLFLRHTREHPFVYDFFAGD